MLIKQENTGSLLFMGFFFTVAQSKCADNLYGPSVAHYWVLVLWKSISVTGASNGSPKLTGAHNSKNREKPAKNWSGVKETLYFHFIQYLPVVFLELKISCQNAPNAIRNWCKVNMVYIFILLLSALYISGKIDISKGTFIKFCNILILRWNPLSWPVSFREYSRPYPSKKACW
jgi:hypothetical protein